MRESYILYQSPFCGFCARVERFLQSRGIEVPTKNTITQPGARRELMEGGGRATVPCLRIEREDGTVRWMYESRDIMDYLAKA
jgi:glutaredoxin